MWCIPTITPEFIERMEDVLDLYAKPYNKNEPVLCFDEKSKQLLSDTKPIKQTNVGMLRHRDYEYKRGGTTNIFLTVEPKGDIAASEQHHGAPDQTLPRNSSALWGCPATRTHDASISFATT